MSIKGTEHTLKIQDLCLTSRWFRVSYTGQSLMNSYCSVLVQSANSSTSADWPIAGKIPQKSSTMSHCPPESISKIQILNLGAISHVLYCVRCKIRKKKTLHRVILNIFVSFHIIPKKYLKNAGDYHHQRKCWLKKSIAANDINSSIFYYSCISQLTLRNLFANIQSKKKRSDI